MVRPDDEEKDVDEFETLDEEAEEVDEFESVDESDAEEPEPEVKAKAKAEGSEDLLEFETFDDSGPDEIETSGMKTKGGDIPGYEPTIDEVLSFGLGKTKDPSEETPPGPEEKSVGESLSSILSKTQPSTEGEEDDLADIFGDDEDEESADEGDEGADEEEKEE